MQVFKAFSIYKPPGQYARFCHKSAKTPEEPGIYGDIIIYGIAKENPNGKVICRFLTTIRTVFKGRIKRFFAVFTLFGGWHIKNFA